jgi:Protein of unknown function (DUF3618)
MADGPDLVPRPGGEVGRPERPAPGSRSAAQIRDDIQREREELGRSVEALRGRVNELTDWRRQVREHKRELAIGAAIVGFAVGGLLALRRR